MLRSPTAERLLHGGIRRENALVALLNDHYTSKFRRAWHVEEKHAPHFTDQRQALFRFVFEEDHGGVYPFFRGFYTADLLQPGDTLLDIGCGDGFITQRFWSTRCAHVDAIDIEPDAIAQAKLRHHADNINYHLQDAIEDPFPGGQYSVIAWDGAMGHFPPESTERMLVKIKAALRPDGVFVGSESLGRHEGHDHLAFFEDLDVLRSLFRKHFAHVQVREQQYVVGRESEQFLRREGYWRCSESAARLQATAWE